MPTNAYIDTGVSSRINGLGPFYPVQARCNLGAALARPAAASPSLTGGRLLIKSLALIWVEC